MGCSGRRSYQDIRPEQKWDFISLNDFKSTSWMTPVAYVYLWASLIVSVAVYGVDTFTAVQLLVFNNWTSEIKPAITIEISRWIFSICIILSWLNLGYEYWRAVRVMKRGAVAESYLDSLAVRVQCIRMGSNGRGWKRFLVFTELTKSKKGADYVALFTYFSFQAWIRIIFCSGPRQVVNALTLYAVYVAQLDPKATDAGTSFVQFFKNIGVLADAHHQQAVILSGMLFTLVVWAFAALSLILALLFYLLFLWHYIPNSDGGLSGYCERKINERLTKIVSAKVAKALEDEERKKLKDARKAAKKGEAPILGRQATIPTLFDAKEGDKLPEMPMLNRNDTMSTLPLYTSRPGTPSSQQPTLPGGFELGNMDQKRPFPLRTGTSSSAMSSTSYSSNAPLVGAAGEMGYARSESPAPSLPQLDSGGFPFPPRSMTSNSNGSQWQRGGPQPMRNGQMGPPSRQMTQDSYNSDPRGPPSRQNTQDPYSPDRRGPPSRQMTMDGFAASPSTYGDAGRASPRPQNNSVDSYGRSQQRGADDFNGRATPGMASTGRRTPFAEFDPAGRSSPEGPRMSSNRDVDFDRSSSGSDSRRRSPPNMTGRYEPNSNDSRAYGPLNPTMRSASAGIPGPAPTYQSQQQRPYRNMTEPMPAPSRQPTGDFLNNGQPPRQGTPQSQRGGYNEQYTAYRPPGSEPRTASPVSYTARPGPTPPPQQSGYRR